MPTSKSLGLQQHSLSVSNFGFSAVGVDKLGASEYTLATIAVDQSGSVADFKKEMEKCLSEIVNACRKSPRADNLLIRLVAFNDTVDEVTGFVPLMDCPSGRFDNCLNPDGMTALYDATVNALEALETYGKTLTTNDYTINGILIVITDGMNNRSTNTAAQAKKLLAKIKKAEALESLVSILVGVNITDPEASKSLMVFESEVGFDQYVEVDNAKAGTLAKLAKFVSQSISSQSKSLGTGTASQPVKF